MSVKMPSSFNQRPTMVGEYNNPQRQRLNVEVYNYTTDDVHVKRGAFNSVMKGLCTMDDPNCCVEIIVEFNFNVNEIPLFFEPETPLDLYAMTQIRDKYHEFSEDDLLVRGGYISGRFTVGIGRGNIGEYTGADGGIHSRLLGISVYAFQNTSIEFKQKPSPYYTGVVLDSEGRPIARKCDAHILYEYVNNSSPDLSLYTMVGSQIVKLIPRQDPHKPDGVTIVSNVGGEVNEIHHALPDATSEVDAFHKAIEANQYFLTAEKALESVNNKSLQHALSMVNDLTKERDRLLKDTQSLKDSHGKLKEANGKMQLKHEQTSIWSKLFEIIIKVPFTVIAHLLENKLTSVLAPKLLGALL